jgi:hypothetical protein
MSNDLDSILSGSSEAVPEMEQEVTQAGGGNQPPEQPTETQAEGDEPQGQKMVPHEALHAEKQKVKRYTEEVADFRKQLSETNAAWERRMAQLVEAVKPKQEAPPKPDWFENPEAATQNAVQSTVSPQFEEMSKTLMANAQLIAGIKYGDDKVATAEQAFIDAMNSGKLDQAEYQKVVSSPNRYAAAVQWHQRQVVQAEIGSDPVAYRAKLEAELREKILAEMNEGGQPQAQQRPAVMPSNLTGTRNVGTRSGPAWGGPSSLNDIFDRTRQPG